MNSLDLLIRHIKDQITISNEDAVDTVKQYWDEAVDTVKSYWGDVDEAIVAETGIPPASITQLLDDHRQAHSYANLGGNSGVASYDLGDDWVLVNFTTGSRYLYTIKSALPEQLDAMKRLAHDGKGLNSYIMRTLKTNYAGRNVKGDILIKPGMEQYSRHAIKRIELLQAFRNTTMNTVSHEGFFDSVKKFLGVSNKDVARPITRSYTYNHGGFSGIMCQYFGNKEWLAKQTFVTGEIDGKGISEWIGVNGKADIFKTIEANNNFEKIRATWANTMDSWYAKVRPMLDKYKDGPFDDTTYDVMKAYFDVTPMPTLPSGLVPKEGWFTSAYSGPIEALTEDEAFKAATNIAASLENIWTKYDNNVEAAKKRNTVYLADQWINLAHSDNPSMSKIKSKHSVKEWKALANKIDGLALYWSDPTWKEALKSYRETFYACAKWIDRSIKGDIAVSSEHYESKNKGDKVKDVTLTKYKGLIAQAGHDGLDPVACQFMQVGLESMDNVLTASIECQDESTVTQRLENLVDKQLVSNEGIFDSIKKLFGGKSTSKSDEPTPVAAIEISAVDKAETFVKSDVTEIPAKTVSKSYSALFLKGGNYNPNWIKDLTRDVAEYERLIRAAVNYEKVIKRWNDKYEPKLRTFLGDADRQPAFLAVLKDYVKDQPKPWIEVYQQNHDYLMFGKSFDNGEDFDRKVAGSDGPTAVDIPELSAAQVKQVVNKVVSAYNDLYNVIFDMNYYGDDFTDPPFRGYSRDAEVIDELNKLKIHAPVSNNPIDHAEAIDSRLSSILSCLANYVS